MQKTIEYMNICRKNRLFYRGVTVGSQTGGTAPGPPEAAASPTRPPQSLRRGRSVADFGQAGPEHCGKWRFL